MVIFYLELMFSCICIRSMMMKYVFGHFCFLGVVRAKSGFTLKKRNTLAKYLNLELDNRQIYLSPT